MYVLAATDGKSCALLVANLTGATQELRIEGVDLAAARYHVIDRERLPCVGLSLDIPFEL